MFTLLCLFFPHIYITPPASSSLPCSISLSISPSCSIFFQSPCVTRNDGYSWTYRKFRKHHLLRLSSKSSLIVCNSSSPKIFYKSTLTVKLSIISITSPIYFISILYSYFVSRPLLFIYLLSISSLFHSISYPNILIFNYHPSLLPDFCLILGIKYRISSLIFLFHRDNPHPSYPIFPITDYYIY